ncbi:hypothetical protein GCM10007160_14740 [Litchfieldella qijiaojingensis]|uniref:Uncharacterized protein n=1 Tax=Litchfieldella qijiaojingensis TaxID=980347 RepID=A0ABQ2YLH3_9GAMM|nr:hypothetical protein [Halomonas qijiaojingensis]GGX88334.1 hypothetical protein GCM10007160_14740 [Halomonas qijiaojingensis]
MERLRSVIQPAYVTLAKRRFSPHMLAIILPSVDKAALVAPLDGRAAVRVALQVWQIRPSSGLRPIGPGPRSPGEQWLSVTESVVETLEVLEQVGAPGVVIRVTAPERRFTPEHYMVGVRLEWLDAEGRYQPDERYIYINPRLGSGPGSHYPASDELRPPQVREDDWHLVDLRLTLMNP